MIVHPGVELDFEHSTAEIGGVTFPACMIEFPTCDRDGESCKLCSRRGGCFFGGPVWTWDDPWAHGAEFFVPLENGLLMLVEITEPPRGAMVEPGTPPQPVADRLLDLALYTRWIYRDPADPDSWLARLVPGSWSWEGGDPEWVAEHIQRIARRIIVPPQEPGELPAKLVPISHPSIRPKENA